MVEHPVFGQLLPVVVAIEAPNVIILRRRVSEVRKRTLLAEVLSPAKCPVLAEGVEKVFWRSDRATMIRAVAFMDNINSR